MNSLNLVKTYPEPPFDKNAILRYAGAKGSDNEISALLDGCLKEIQGKISYKVCYRELFVSVKGGECDFTAFKVKSESLAKNLENCNRVILFAATLGVQTDRLVARYGSISPAKALIFQAIGAERIEALCDIFCKEIESEGNITLGPRFSPGYGDLPLETQKDIFSLLDCSRNIGLTLNDSMLMSPAKSVTAFVGITQNNPRGAL